MTSWKTDLRDNVAYILLDVTTHRHNFLTSGVIDELDLLLDVVRNEFAGKNPDGLVIASAKSDGFNAGWDLADLDRIENAAEAEDLAERGRRVVDKIASLDMPTVAVLHGPALGAGLELALACTYRVASLAPATRLGLPDIKVGLLPALGGIERLVELLGARVATGLLLSGEALSARDALQVGLVDAVAAPARIETMAVSLLRERPLMKRPEDGFLGQWLATRAFPWLGLKDAEKRAQAAGQDGSPAYGEIVALVKRALASPSDPELAASLAADVAAAFGRLAISEEARALRYFSFLETSHLREKPSEAEPLPLRSAAVVGARGGSALALGLALRRIPVRVHAREEAEALAVLRALGRRCDAGADSGLIPAFAARQALGLVAAGADPALLRRVDLVAGEIEAEGEERDTWLAALAAAAPRVALLAFDVGAVRVAEWSSALVGPERCAGYRAGDAALGNRLAEIAPGPATSAAAVASLFALARLLDRTPLLVRDTPGGCRARLLHALLMEAVRLIEDGVTPDFIEHTALRFGFAEGPLAALDAIGLDRFRDQAVLLEKNLHARFAPPPFLARLIMEEGFLARAGRFGGRVRTELLRMVGIEVQQMPESVVEDRLALALLLEAARCLEEGVVPSPEDLDLVSVHGLGFPRARGGLLTWATTIGFAEIERRLAQMPDEDRARLAPPAFLRDLLA